jgi:hypothetical protein
VSCRTPPPITSAGLDRRALRDRSGVAPAGYLPYRRAITADLARIRALRVISRTSAFQYRGTTKSVRTIGDELSVRYVLEGSVRRSDDDLRVTCQLIDATLDAHLWAMKHDGTMKEVFAVQERVARAAADSLAVRLGSREREAISARPIADPRAYELYLRARQEFNRGDMPEALDNAVAFLREGAGHHRRECGAARPAGPRTLPLDPGPSRDHRRIRDPVSDALR